MKDSHFIQLLEKNRHDFYRFVYRNLWNTEEVEDVFSSAVAAAYENIDRFTEGTNFRAWMYKILINKCFVANRELKRSAVSLESVDDFFVTRESQQYGEVLENPDWFIEECDEEVINALSSLSTMERSCFLLLALAKYSYREISEILDIPVGTVMTHLSRGRARLRRSLVRYAEQNGILPKKRRQKHTQEEII